ncbi:3'-phosphoadenylsulfate reductase [Gnomoniopsis smithogilvyi]|uniref:phosphoadenylyl-sulfate reductase (thioredoxin) n=1 Tax=Gnomoniopsis smithogilvyi TaxID=1191159 RepID=A0A9W9CSY0_9PEZI|nr:3'-phosphoadenylsulfate reductase [Gnomoniopsis smithogilvyi]
MSKNTYAQSDSSSASTSPRLSPLDTKSSASSVEDLESGYGSATSSTMTLPAVQFTPFHLKWLNARFENMHPIDILRHCKILFPNLYQSTAFGLSGLVTIDMLSKLEQEFPRPIDIIFLDTLYHFQETLDLVERIRQRYPSTKVHVFKPDGCETARDFEALHGPNLWETAAEMYDWYAKVEPQQRSYTELNVAAILTGRRRSQGGQRDKIPVIELDEERGVVKINPLVKWTFDQVQSYIREHNVPYNALLDQGYKSVGDWHSTSPVAAGEDERAGRWKGQAKTECGIHNKKSRYAEFLRKKQEEDMAKAFQNNTERAGSNTSNHNPVEVSV